MAELFKELENLRSSSAKVSPDRWEDRMTGDEPETRDDRFGESTPTRNELTLCDLIRHYATYQDCDQIASLDINILHKY